MELSVNETEATRSELGYTNALRLTGSLLYLKNRVYDAEARVFIRPDTVDRLRYAYVWGDPVNLSDPTGLLPQDTVIAFNNPVQLAVAEIMAWWSRTSWFTEVQANSTKKSEQQTEKEGEKQKENKVSLTNEQAEVERRKQEGLPEDLVETLDKNATDLRGRPYPPRENGSGPAIEKNEDGSVKSCDCGGCTHEVFQRSGMAYEYRNSTGLISQDANGQWQSQLKELAVAQGPVPGAIGVIPGKHVFLYLGEKAMAGKETDNTKPPVQADSWSARRAGFDYGRTAWEVAYKADKEKVVWLIYVGRQP